MILRFMKHNKYARNFVNNSIGKAYDEGYKSGMLQFAKENLGKNYVKKVKKVINNAYNKENLRNKGAKIETRMGNLKKVSPAILKEDHRVVHLSLSSFEIIQRWKT